MFNRYLLILYHSRWPALRDTKRTRITASHHTHPLKTANRKTRNHKPCYRKPRYRKPRYRKPRYRKPRYRKPRYRKPRYRKPRYCKPAIAKLATANLAIAKLAITNLANSETPKTASNLWNSPPTPRNLNYKLRIVCTSLLCVWQCIKMHYTIISTIPYIP